MPVNTEITKSAFARLKGVSPTAIDKAIAAGQIKKGWNTTTRKIIQEIADKEYTPSLDKVTTSAPTTLQVEKPKRTFPTDEEADDLDGDFLEAEGLNPEDLKVTKEDDYNAAKTKHTKIQFLVDKQKLLKEQGRLLDRDKVDDTLFKYANAFRRELENLALRITPNMRAAETDHDAQLIFQRELKALLERYANGVDLTKEN